jgi:hypothetical protein
MVDYVLVIHGHYPTQTQIAQLHVHSTLLECQ